MCVSVKIREESNITLSTTEVKLRPTTKRQNLTTSDAVNKLTTGGPALTDKLPLPHPFDTYFPLMNTNGKCLAVETTGTIKPSENGAKIIQADCNPSEKGQRWKWDRKNETLCNEWNKCISSPFNQKWGQTFDVFHWDLADPKNCSQIWLLSNVGKIVHSRLCLTFKGNSDAHGAKAFTDFCNIAKIWSFYRY